MLIMFSNRNAFVLPGFFRAISVYEASHRSINTPYSSGGFAHDLTSDRAWRFHGAAQVSEAASVKCSFLGSLDRKIQRIGPESD
jgi:hypothetical protein